MGVVFGMLLVLGGVAAAQEPPGAATRTAVQREADALVEAGHAAFEGGRFPAALTHYRRALGLTDDPEILLQLGRTHDALREDIPARAAYHEYLDRVPRSPRRAEIQARLRAIESSLRDRPVASPETAEDGTVVRPGMATWTEPGTAASEWSDGEQDAEDGAVVDEDESEAAILPPPPARGARADAPRPRDEDDRWPDWVWIAAGISVGAAVGAVIALVIVATDGDEDHGTLGAPSVLAASF